MHEYCIPVGFCLTTSAYCAWKSWASSGVGRGGHDILPPIISELLNREYDRLARSDDSKTGEPAVAVRSSGVYEDSAGHSFAGQYDTYLNVIGSSAVARAIVRCWQSATTGRVVAYCRARKIPADNLRLAVLVQRFVAADVSVVAFSRNRSALAVTGS